MPGNPKQSYTVGVLWIIIKYKTTGHLFQNRFKSEVVDDDRYLLTVIR